MSDVLLRRPYQPSIQGATMDGGDGRTFIFVSEQNGRMFAFTRDSTGGNLPGHFGPWRQTERHAVNPSGAVLGGNGYFLCRPDGMAW